jgi:formylglycine-generating enzyme required for sulfatase activity
MVLKKMLHLNLACFMLVLLCSPVNPTQFPADRFEPYAQALPGTDITISMIPISGGEYLQGSPNNEMGRKPDEGPQHLSKIEDFWMGKFEITWQQYELFMQRAIDNINFQSQKGEEIHIEIDGVSAATTPYVDMSFGMGKINRPAINITQYAASMYCQWLSSITGNYYRLPTEAEWEYACRAGSTSSYSFGDDMDKLNEYAWYYDNSDDKYHAVGEKKPNAWGLHDMHGNVAEWTLDQYAPDFYSHSSSSTGNEWNFPNTLYPRTTRGGSWNDDPDKLRSAARNPSNPKWKRRDPQIPKSLWWLTNAPFVGFRVIRPRVTPSQIEIEKYWMKPIKDI